VHVGRTVLRRPVTARAARCLTVSLITTIVSTTTLVTLAVGVGVAAALSNVVAVALGTALSYVLNRRWVWRRTGRSSVAREITPFWVMNLIGLLVSTVAVHVVANATSTWPAARRAIALPAANLATWGVLWVVQFVVLDRLIFRAGVTDLAPAASTDQLAA
jgi:putative flippase GtrA